MKWTYQTLTENPLLMCVCVCVQFKRREPNVLAFSEWWVWQWVVRSLLVVRCHKKLHKMVGNREEEWGGRCIGRQVTQLEHLDNEFGSLCVPWPPHAMWNLQEFLQCQSEIVFIRSEWCLDVGIWERLFQKLFIEYIAAGDTR